MTNFFEQATDELTQDSFLSWLVSNTNDSVIGKISKKFINFLWDEKNSLNEEKIEFVSADRQFKKIDIIVNFKVNGKPHCLIIEDKTNSSEHSDQLQKYKDEVLSWPETSERPTSYVYYKTGELNDDEIKKTEKAGFRIVELKDIYNFFKTLNTDSEIINHYSEHIKNLYEERDVVSKDKNTINWSFENWKTYCKKIISPRYNNLTFYYSFYLGRYFSLIIYFKGEFSESSCLEIFFRKGNEISATVHPYKCNGSDNTWKRVNNPIICRKIDEKFRTCKNDSFKRFGKSQTVATSIKNIEKEDIETVELKLIKWINDFIEFFNELNVK